MSLILKAEFNGEIRRVGLSQENDANIEQLEAKLRILFPQLTDPFLMTSSNVELHSDSDVATVFAEAAGKKPPMVRISVNPNRARKVDVPAPQEEEYVQIPSPVETSTTEQSFADWTSISQPVSAGRKCRLCEVNSVEGVHYKCLNCLDFEICTHCEEAHPAHDLAWVHDASHLFVKMRCHVDSLPLERQLIFKSHIDNPNEKELAKEEKKKLREKKVEIDNRKKEAREAERKKRAQDKLKRLQARKEKVSNKKAKLTAAEKKKKTAAVSKVKRAKKIVASQPVADEEAVVTTTETLAQEEPAKEESNFSFMRLLSDFQILKEAVAQQPEEQAKPVEPKVEIELEELPEQLTTTPSAVAAIEPEVVVADVEEVEEVVKPQEQQESPFAKNLQILADMGFTDTEKNIELLVKNVGNLDATVNQLLNPQPFATLSKWLPFTIGL